jgi:hypothetical protein
MAVGLRPRRSPPDAPTGSATNPEGFRVSVIAPLPAQALNIHLAGCGFAHGSTEGRRACSRAQQQVERCRLGGG